MRAARSAQAKARLPHAAPAPPRPGKGPIADCPGYFAEYCHRGINGGLLRGGIGMK